MVMIKDLGQAEITYEICWREEHKASIPVDLQTLFPSSLRATYLCLLFLLSPFLKITYLCEEPFSQYVAAWFLQKPFGKGILCFLGNQLELAEQILHAHLFQKTL